MASLPSDESGDRVLRWAFGLFSAVSVGLALTARYHPGVDLPQHGNLLQVLAEYRSDATDYPEFYRVDLNTPYLLAYALAWPFAKVFGALAGIRVVFAATSVLLPWSMIRWLRAIGGQPWFGLFGFVLAFGFPYLWGFFSHVLAMPLVFVYLTAFEKQGLAPTPRRILATSAASLALLYCHGITFAVGAASTGILCLLPFRLGAMLRRGVHIVPSLVVFALWFTGHRQTDMPAWADFPKAADRAVNLLSSPFWPSAKPTYALITAAVVLAVVGSSGVSFRLDRRALVPFAVSLLGFFFLPEWVGGTWLVGTRFCSYVHCFLFGLLGVRSGRVFSVTHRATVLASVAAGLAFFGVRLRDFNRELAGLAAIAAEIGPSDDVRTLVCDTEGDSKVFGWMELCQTPAWITAERGGLLENDYGRYLQLPVQRRRDRPFPSRFHYFVAHGNLRRADAVARHLVGPVRLRDRRGQWILYEAEVPSLPSAGLSVVRSSEGWGKLHVDRSVTAHPLSIAGTPYEHGLGTHARSYVRVHPLRLASKLVGACGIDDGAGDGGAVIFRIRTLGGTVLFDSGAVFHGEAARPFSVPVTTGEDLVFEGVAVGGSTANAHMDWVGLELR